MSAHTRLFVNAGDRFGRLLVIKPGVRHTGDCSCRTCMKPPGGAS